jgi:hypothetical protein
VAERALQNPNTRAWCRRALFVSAIEKTCLPAWTQTQCCHLPHSRDRPSQNGQRTLALEYQAGLAEIVLPLSGCQRASQETMVYHQATRASWRTSIRQTDLIRSIDHLAFKVTFSMGRQPQSPGPPNLADPLLIVMLPSTSIYQESHPPPLNVHSQLKAPLSVTLHRVGP